MRLLELSVQELGQWLRENFQTISNWATLLSFVVSALALWITLRIQGKVNRLSGTASFKGRLNEFSSKVRGCAEYLAESLSGTDFDEMATERTLRMLQSSVKSMSRVAPENLNSQMAVVSEKLTQLTEGGTYRTKSELRQLYNDLTSLEADLSTYDEEENWKFSA